jgi:hypothetical protein
LSRARQQGIASQRSPTPATARAPSDSVVADPSPAPLFTANDQSNGYELYRVTIPAEQIFRDGFE